jgi:hypothetical protein
MLPTPAVLEQVLSVCSQASLSREEGRLVAGHIVIRAPAVPTRQSMLIILGLLLTAIILVSMLRMRLNGNGKGAQLGHMSEQWLAEQRSVRPS